MGQGLQVWDATGQLILDIGSRPFKALSQVNWDGVTTTDIVDAALTSGSLLYQAAATSGDDVAPVISQSGDTITLEASSEGNSPYLFKYGIW